MKVLQGRFRVAPAVVAGAAVEVDEPEALDLHAEGQDGVGPGAHEGLIVGRILRLQLVETGRGVVGNAQYFGQQRGGILIGEDSIRHATRIYPSRVSWKLGWQRFARLC